MEASRFCTDHSLKNKHGWMHVALRNEHQLSREMEREGGGVISYPPLAVYREQSGVVCERVQNHVWCLPVPWVWPSPSWVPVAWVLSLSSPSSYHPVHHATRRTSWLYVTTHTTISDCHTSYSFTHTNHQ